MIIPITGSYFFTKSFIERKPGELIDLNLGDSIKMKNHIQSYSITSSTQPGLLIFSLDKK